MSLVLLINLAYGGYDQSGGFVAENLSMQSFNATVPAEGVEYAPPTALVPQVPATAAGNELAVYSNVMPVATDLTKLIPFAAQLNQQMYIYYNGGYMVWNGFNAIFPDSTPLLWIENYGGWSWYATMPEGSWSQELIFVQTASPVSIYEIYPGGYVLQYNLGYVQPGFYYIWYYADVPGRHKCLVSVGGKFSNWVIIDVYYPWVPPVPPSPTPKEKCESNPQCNWVNGHCYCRGILPDDPKTKCESNPLCDWVNGQCLCRGLIDPKAECESNPLCDWSEENNQCLCRGLNPDDPEAECESNPQCNWANGQCLCRGLNPDNPEQEQCEQNPSCHWANDHCLCTGADIGGDSDIIGGNSGTWNGGSDDSAREQCEQNPSCHWANGHCLCTGARTGGDSGLMGLGAEGGE